MTSPSPDKAELRYRQTSQGSYSALVFSLVSCRRTAFSELLGRTRLSGIDAASLSQSGEAALALKENANAE